LHGIPKKIISDRGT
jgi:transposase InsO family protein